jgi:hypothetical protein
LEWGASPFQSLKIPWVDDQYSNPFAMVQAFFALRLSFPQKDIPCQVKNWSFFAPPHQNWILFNPPSFARIGRWFQLNINLKNPALPEQQAAKGFEAGSKLCRGTSISFGA